MGSLCAPRPVKLFAGLIAAEPSLFDAAQADLARAIENRVDLESAVLDFHATSYYCDEMGDGLKRKFVAFSDLAGLGAIHKVKIASRRIEDTYARCGKRRINIDPGYLDLSKVVLLSTKDFTHRIYLDDGIYAEVTLFFKDRTFQAWPWTYPDYKGRPYIDFFNALRTQYKKTIDAGKHHENP